MVSIKVLVILFGIVLLATKTSAAKPGCCEKYTKDRLPFHVIEGYSVQTITPMCDIDAIIFHTRRGKVVCTDPTLDWVMDYVDRLMKKAKRVHKRAAKLPQKTSKV